MVCHWYDLGSGRKFSTNTFTDISFFMDCCNCLLSPAGWEIIKRIPSVCVCVTFLKRAVHHTGCFSLAFSMFYDLIAYVFSFDAVFSDLGP